MSYQTKRPATRSLLAFGVGVTLAITQLGAGCVPANPNHACGPDATADDSGGCVSTPAGDGSKGDAK